MSISPHLSAPRGHLLGLPPEIVCKILALLPFEAVAATASVCKDLRSLALSERKLWQELPMATLYNVHKLQPFFFRAGPLGMDLSVTDIEQRQIRRLSDLLCQTISSLRSLRLHFQNVDDPDVDGLCTMWRALSQPAPLLQRLALVSDTYHDTLGAVPRGVFASQPTLVALELTAFALPVDGPCAAFAQVQHVTASVAAVCPLPQARIPAGPDTPWANAPLHAHFPAVRSLELLGIEPVSAGDDHAHSIIRLPYIDRALGELSLQCELDDEDTETVRWLDEGLRHVARVVLDQPDAESAAARDAVLLSLAGSPVSLRIRRCGLEFVELAVGNSERRMRAGRFPRQALGGHLAKVLTCMHVAALWIPAGAADLVLEVLAMFTDQLQLLCLGLSVDGGLGAPPTGLAALNSVHTLRFEASEHEVIDARDVLAFASAVAPKVTSIVASKTVSLINSNALAHSVYIV